MKASLENLLEMQNFRILRFSPRTKDLKGGEVGSSSLSLNKPQWLLKLGGLY